MISGPEIPIYVIAPIRDVNAFNLYDRFGGNYHKDYPL